jgi:hypothetical protein
VRVLVSPEGQIADGLLATNPMSDKELQPTAVARDGVSPVLPSPPGAPTCSRVVLLGLDPSGGGPTCSAHVLYSGVASADILSAMPMDVEVASSSLAPGDAAPKTRWFADGKTLVRKVPGKGTLTVAALGPELDSRYQPTTPGSFLPAPTSCGGAAASTSVRSWRSTERRFARPRTRSPRPSGGRPGRRAAPSGRHDAAGDPPGRHRRRAEGRGEPDADAVPGRPGLHSGVCPSYGLLSMFLDRCRARKNRLT